MEHFDKATKLRNLIAEADAIQLGSEAFLTQQNVRIFNNNPVLSINWRTNTGKENYISFFDRNLSEAEIIGNSIYLSNGRGEKTVIRLFKCVPENIEA